MPASEIYLSTHVLEGTADGFPGHQSDIGCWGATFVQREDRNSGKGTGAVEMIGEREAEKEEDEDEEEGRKRTKRAYGGKKARERKSNPGRGGVT